MATPRVKGEVETLEYEPGTKLPERTPPDEGVYNFTLGENRNLKEVGKGWKAKPGKYPNRLLFVKALDTEDAATGKEKECREIISLSPGALRLGPMRLAQAAQYPLKLKLGPEKTPNHPTVRENAIAIDKMLLHIKEQELVLRGEVSHEEYNGEKQGRVKWLPPEELDQTAQIPSDAADDDVFSGDNQNGAIDETQAPFNESEAMQNEAADQVEAREDFEPIPPPRMVPPKNGAPKAMQSGQKKPAPVKHKKK